ncbi:MAG: (d)CMP kinase [Prevotellaceae bacterium]|jgi:cytidylate kinase|nr:(d)CMP kinase [Prevotellaceae bacterium]
MKGKKIIVAIDGYSSTGKSSFARQIAQNLSYIYVDTGAMYRAVTLYCIENNFIGNCGLNVDKIIGNLKKINIKFVFNDKNGKSETFLNGKNIESKIRNVEVSNHVSAVSAIPEVRTQMVELQQEMGKNKGIVMDGRDIGTVVFPDAEIKIFMTAKPEIRARRRYLELLQNGENVTLQEIEKNIRKRDYIDTHRNTSPLKKADDAIILDNSDISIDEQMQWFEKIFQSVIKKDENDS